MAQENLYMFKRLKEKTSYYDFSKYDKEYDQAQYYKRSHCSLLPSIDFNRNKRTISIGLKNRTLYNSLFNVNNSNSFNNINISKSNNFTSPRNYYYGNKNQEQNLFNNNLYKKTLEELKYEDFLDNKNIDKKEKKINEIMEETHKEKNKDDIKEEKKEKESNNKNEIDKKIIIKEDEDKNKNKKEEIKTDNTEDNKEQRENNDNSENNKSIKI